VRDQLIQISPKAETRATDPHDEKQVFDSLKSNTTQRSASWTADPNSWLAGERKRTGCLHQTSKILKDCKSRNAT